MRLVHAAALAAAALLLASFASAQGLGDAAAREREKRKTDKAASKPAKVFTEADLATGSTPQSPDAPESPAADGKTASGKPKSGAEADADKAAAEEKAKAELSWHKRLEQARKEAQAYRDVADKLQLDINDTSGGLYGPGRASKIAFLDETKQKLAEVQGRLTALEDEGRRAGYQ